MKKLKHIIDLACSTVSFLMCAAMMIILLVNVILRLIPSIGGFSWYMESSQYLNVWSMLIVGISICLSRSHLKVNIIDDACQKLGPAMFKLQQGFVSLCITVFYIFVAYGGYLYATKSKQAISTMPMFKMSMVYWMFPVAGILCALATILDYISFLTEGDKGNEGGTKA